MNRQTILLISDMRQVYLAEIMTKRGLNVRCLDIRNSGTVKEQLEKLKSFLAEADMLILPIPVTKIPEQKMLNDILNKNLTNDTLVLGGCFSTEQQELLERRDIHYLDFMRDEIVTEENAVATAEGVIAELVNHSPYNIEEAKIIVTGYGCCGRAVAARLKALGARVTVLARRREVRKLAKKDGFYAADFAFGPEEAMGAAMLVNTVPAPVVTGAIIRELPRDAYILDIASKPGGTDFACARKEIQRLCDMGANVVPVFSFNAQTCDTRFGSAKDYVDGICEITGNEGIRTICAAEPIGPNNFLDIMVIAPCTGNTAAKLCNGITDTPVLMATKAHMRNGKPLVIAISTNDALGASFKNIGMLMNMKNIYFVPFGQDNCKSKPNSMIAKMELLPDTIEAALAGKQIQPILQTPT